MAEFHLIQGIFRGLHGRDEYRLLFEYGAAGVFVWLTPDFALKGFQASTDDMAYAVYSRSAVGVRFMAKSDRPFTESLTQDHMSDAIVSLFADAQCKEFPSLFSMLRSLFAGSAPESFTLPPQERDAVLSRNITDYMQRFRY